MHGHERIANELAHEINDGVYEAGETLPTIVDLMERFDLGRSTVRQALEKLAQMGLVYAGYTDGKRGMIVRDRTRVPYYATDGTKAREGKRDCFRHAAERSGKKASSEFELRWCIPDEEIRQRLGTSEHEMTVARISKQLLNGQPWSYEMSFYPHDLAKETGVDTPKDIPEGAYLKLAEKGYPPTSHVEEVMDSSADHEMAKILSIPVGSPVVVHYLTGATSERLLFVSRWVRLGRQVRMIWERGEEQGINIINDIRGGL